MKKPRIPKEYLGAFKKGHRHAAREYVDEEFAEGLLRLSQSGVAWAREALEWITKFNNEYYKCVFTKTSDDIIQTSDERKERYTAQNKRQIDLIANVKVMQLMSDDGFLDMKGKFDPRAEDYSFYAEYDPDLVAGAACTPSGEDELIELLDLKREMEKSKKQ